MRSLTDRDCKSMAPTYDTLGTAYAHASSDVLIAKVDADAHKELGKRFGVQGFPTLKWFDGKSEKPEDYNGGRELDDMAKFVEGKTSLKAKVKKVESNVVMLNDAKWNSSVGAARGAFVAFTAPWCGRKRRDAFENDRS
jgi:protein disulfide-isomerase A6